MHKCLLGIALVLTLSARALGETVAFIGDSISTGGGAHPALAYDATMIEKVFNDTINIEPNADYFATLASWGLNDMQALPPRRLELSAREFEHPLNWVYDRALHYVSHRYMDAEEYSWAYLWARKQGIAASDILIAARDGERAQQARRQVDRVLDATGSQAVRHLFVFFTGNDLCAPDVSFATTSEDFGQHIEEAVRYYIRNAQTSEGIYHIWLVDPLGILQIVTAPDILNQKVRAFDTEVSCRDLQAGRFKGQEKAWTDPHITPADIFLNVFGQGPRGYCPSLFAVHQGPAEIQMKIGSLLSSYRKALGQVNDSLQVLPPQFRVHQIKATGDVLFKGEDMANDCFHLNLKGQLKVAQSIDAEVQKLVPPPAL